LFGQNYTAKHWQSMTYIRKEIFLDAIYHHNLLMKNLQILHPRYNTL
jgi:hypothetical protein